MIFIDRIINVTNGVSKIDEPIILYRGDYDIAIRFTINNSNLKFKSGFNMIEYTNSSYAQVAMLKPNMESVFSEMIQCSDGIVEFIISRDMIDDLQEVGRYSFHIRLFDYSKGSRITIPPVENGIIIREPIASEDFNNNVEEALVGYAVARNVSEQEDEPGGDNGYPKTNWVNGDKITVDRLNKIENALYDIYDRLQIIEDELLIQVDALNKQQTNNYAVLSAEIEAIKESLGQVND